VLASLVAACASITAHPNDGSVAVSTAAELDAANAAFSEAWVAADTDALLAAYTDDAVVHPPAGGVLTTPAHVRALLGPAPSQRRVGHRLEPTLRQTLRGGEVLEMGRWHSARENEAGEAPWSSGCYTVIWRNDAGRWRMKYDGWTAANDNSWACRPRAD
jgi:ketosteroid isomerase-like protein